MLFQLEQWLLNSTTGSLSLKENGCYVEHAVLEHAPLQVLLCLIKHQGNEVSKDTLLKEVWPNAVFNEDDLSMAISQIRHALGDDAHNPSYVEKISGVGYRLMVEVIEHHESKEEPKTDSHKTVIQVKAKPYPMVYRIVLLLLLIYFYWTYTG